MLASSWRWGIVLAGFLAGGCALAPQLGPAPQVGPPRPPLTAKAPGDTTAAPVSTAADSAAADLNRAFTERFPGGVVPIPPEEIHPRPRPPADQGAGAAGDTESGPIGDSRTAGSEGTETNSAPNASGNSPESPADSSGAPAISVDLPPEELARLESSARADLAWADSTAQSAALGTLRPRDRDKLETALGLIRQGQEAFRRGDVRGAANLAYKARLLVQEVVPK